MLDRKDRHTERIPFFARDPKPLGIGEHHALLLGVVLGHHRIPAERMHDEEERLLPSHHHVESTRRKLRIDLEAFSALLLCVVCEQGTGLGRHLGNDEAVPGPRHTAGTEDLCH